MTRPECIHQRAYKRLIKHLKRQVYFSWEDLFNRAPTSVRLTGPYLKHKTLLQYHFLTEKITNQNFTDLAWTGTSSTKENIQWFHLATPHSITLDSILTRWNIMATLTSDLWSDPLNNATKALHPLTQCLHRLHSESSTLAEQQLQSSVRVYTRCIQAQYCCIGHLRFGSTQSWTHNHCSYVWKKEEKYGSQKDGQPV